MANYKRIVLASRPEGEVSTNNFRVESVPVPEPDDGEVLVRNRYLSLDPYMRMRMENVRSYAAPQELDEVMVGATVGEVVTSRHPEFEEGDRVTGMLGWSEMGVTHGANLRKLDTSQIPLTAYLGPAGMPGMTAWYGLTRIIQPKPGETVVVDAASGAVGSVVGQLARDLGCRAVGIAGGPEKCAYVVDELGFDACIDYKGGNLKAELAEATPNGVDGIFENVGGEIFDTSLARINPFGRVALCGLISGYEGQDLSLKNVRALLTMRVTLQGFIIADHMDLWPQGLKQLGALIAAGDLKYRESIAEGIESAPEAFLGLLTGRNFGKQLVKL